MAESSNNLSLKILFRKSQELRRQGRQSAFGDCWYQEQRNVQLWVKTYNVFQSEGRYDHTDLATWSFVA